MSAEHPGRSLRQRLLPYLTKASHVSAPFISTFLLIHLTAPVVANAGGSGLSSMTMILGREYYQTVIGEPWLVLTPLAVHALSGVVRRALLTLPRLWKRLINSEPRPNGNTSYSKLFTFTPLTLSAYPLLFLLPIHFVTHRILPMTPGPPIHSLGPAELDFNFVAHGLKTWPIRSWLMYSALVGCVAVHAVEGSKVLMRKWSGEKRSEREIESSLLGPESEEPPLTYTETKTPPRSAGKRQTRIPTYLVASLITLPVLSGLYFIFAEPTWVFPDTVKRFNAVYLSSWFYRI
ncbi:hypothetical protein VKT23_013190 [Stygiomarasmius scandens]|uniref:Mitochondrial adapter protein MCP1 transmembrane domain-containing protein n=1 Tax=Marasmiellus scandens TaxID=2682957 RepID=A0ABR1J6M0_9AGAR